MSLSSFYLLVMDDFLTEPLIVLPLLAVHGASKPRSYIIDE
jgi:hypothetical protein